MNDIHRLVLCVLLLLPACENEPDIVFPSFGAESMLASAEPLPEEAGSRIEGVYRVLVGNAQFGDSLVVRWIKSGISMFGKQNAVFFLLGAGRLDTTIIIEGTWRYAVNVETGLVRLHVTAGEGGRYLRDGSPSAVPLTLRGSYGGSGGSPASPLVLQFHRPFSANVRQRPFWVLAHRGGGRNSEYLGVSENTIAMIERTERHGSDGVELDVHVSSDGVPFLYHDDDLNLRLVQRGVLWGPVENYSWAQLRSLVRLVNGERIPSLEEALDVIVRRTSLKLVWLDLKSGKDEMATVIALQQKFRDLAGQLGRTVEILVGVGDEDHFERLARFPGHEDVPSLCELELEDVRRLNSRVWAPRWTRGTLDAEVQQMHAEGRRAFTWTLDDPAFVERFFEEGAFDGMLTNYPSLVAYHHYVR